MGELDGRVALVTGGGRGVGRGISELLAEAGATVAVNYRRDAHAASDTVAFITSRGGRARAYLATIDDAEQDAAMVEQVVADFAFVDILVCSAGIASRGKSVAKTDPAELQRVMAINALSAHHLSRLVLPSMRTRPRGDIVMISSAATTYHHGWGAPYNMAKAAQEALAFTLAKEERRHGIHVNVVAPGFIETEMGRRLAKAAAGVDDLRELDGRAAFGRVCQPLDVAKVVLWLCSDGAGYLTGQRIECDGGIPTPYAVRSAL
jgi:NAD(P)-dependent dehydrogenase (short-subunit alcohol dehydrogenase family)